MDFLLDYFGEVIVICVVGLIIFVFHRIRSWWKNRDTVAIELFYDACGHNYECDFEPKMTMEKQAEAEQAAIAFGWRIDQGRGRIPRKIFGFGTMYLGRFLAVLLQKDYGDKGSARESINP